MEDLVNQIISSGEIPEKFKDEDVRMVMERNYLYSKELLENKLSNARTIYGNSSRNFFSSLTFMFAGVALAFTLLNVLLSLNSENEILQLVGVTGTLFLGLVVIVGGSVLSGRFGTDFRKSELEMRVIPLMLEYNSRNEVITKENETREVEGDIKPN